MPAILRLSLLPILALATLTACGDDDDAPETMPTLEATTTSTPTAFASPSPATSPTSPSTPVTAGLDITLPPPTGAIDPSSVVQADIPPSPFTFPGYQVAALYDVVEARDFDLEGGSLGDFSPDGRYYAWVKHDQTGFTPDGRATLLDIQTGDQRDIMAGYGTFFASDGLLVVLTTQRGGGSTYDITTGDTEEVDPTQVSLLRRTEDGRQARETTPDGFRVQALAPSGTLEVRPYRVTGSNDGRTHLRFEALAAAPAGNGHLVAASAPSDDGLSGIYLVSIADGSTELIGTARVTFNFPLVGGDRHIAWVDNFCGGVDHGDLHTYDRIASTLTRVERTSQWGALEITPIGLLGIGDFGPAALFDPATLEYTAVLPGETPDRDGLFAGDTRWSSDYRYAARGATGGHGGLCPDET